MPNEALSRRQLTIAALVVIASLSTLLIPGVTADVARVPQNALNCVLTAWSWIETTWTTVTSWL